MITGMERLAAAAEGKILDRIPVFCNLLDQGARELGMTLKEYYSNGEHVAEAQLRMRRKYGYDNVWSLMYVAREAELLGCRKIIYAQDGPPNVGEMIIGNYKDIHALQIPKNLSAHPAFQDTLNCLRILKAQVGGKYPICAYLTASMTLPAEVRDELLTKCSVFFRKQIAALRSAGADIFVYSNPFGSLDIIPQRIFDELSLKWMEADLKPGGTQGVVYYCGSAKLNSVIEAVLTRIGITAYYPSPLEDLAEAKRIIAGRALCAGVFNDIQLINWSREQIRSEVKRIIQAGMPGGRFFFGTVVMPYSIPQENITCMLEAVYEFGSHAYNN